jgi:uncharacterized membrane protein
MGGGASAQALGRRRLDEKQYERADSAERRARGLGWFSVALGAAQLIAPGGLARFVLGREDLRRRGAMRALGLRELACGAGILSRPHPTGWLWMRVAGDLMDLALLGRSLTARRTDKAAVIRSMASVLGVTVLDTITSVQLSRAGRAGLRPRRPRRFVKAITVNRPPDEVYRFWRNFENLPRFMAHLESVELRDERRSRWSARGPGGAKVQWEAELIEDRPNELVAWRSVEGSDIDNAGTVRFRRATGNRGTEIQLELQYAPPGGKLGVGLAKLLGKAPEQQVEGDLRRFKQVIEVGEVVHSDASIHRGRHPARPPSENERTWNGGRR